MRLLLDKGDGKAEVTSEARVDDGQWHTVVAHFNPTAMEVTVDGRSVSARLDRGGNQYLDLHEVVSEVRRVPGVPHEYGSMGPKLKLLALIRNDYAYCGSLYSSLT